MNTPDPRSASEAVPTPVDSHGAVDLSARASAPAAAGPDAPAAAGEGLHIPLITTTDEENFQDVMST
ncbi:MAG: tetratricopeptide repeat protein, partial [Schaalia odontolytica]